MLINAQRPEELRVAIVSGSHLESYQVEVATSGLTRSNIYRGVIANVQPSLNAAFIDYGGDRHGFLAIQDVVPEAYYHSPRGGGKARIEEVLEKGRPIVVQVTREAEAFAAIYHRNKRGLPTAGATALVFRTAPPRATPAPTVSPGPL